MDNLELRNRIENAIESLVSLLDTIDGDENLEPYLAGTHPDNNDLEHDTCDDEPYLSAGAAYWQSINPGNGFTVDLEDDPAYHDGCGFIEGDQGL